MLLAQIFAGQQLNRVTVAPAPRAGLAVGSVKMYKTENRGSFFALRN